MANTAGKAVMRSSGKMGILSSGKVALYNASGTCASCCAAGPPYTKDSCAICNASEWPTPDDMYFDIYGVEAGHACSCMDRVGEHGDSIWYANHPDECYWSSDDGKALVTMIGSVISFYYTCDGHTARWWGTRCVGDNSLCNGPKTTTLSHYDTAYGDCPDANMAASYVVLDNPGGG